MQPEDAIDGDAGRAAIDWDAAARRAARVVRAGPPIDRPGLDALVSSLREAAADAPAYVAEVTRLPDAARAVESGTVLVLDRPRWAASAVDTFRTLTDGLLPATKMPGGATLAGEQVGLLLALLATRVLGQYDPYARPASAERPGRLVLVAPNVLHVQRQLGADPQDFHLWVCLHEQTHAVQFAAAPWLADHLAEQIREIVGALADVPAQGRRLGDLLRGVRRVLEGPGESDDDDAPSSATPSLLEAVLEQPEQERMDHVLATMSLLEGHADVVMDAVGPRVIPSVATIRASFEKRRDTRGTDLLIRRLLGMDAKLLQYRQGAAFVRGVLDRVGHDGLAAVWATPDHLPTPAEILAPEAWVARVHG
ncbi:conserved hypothetical protein [Beutenbergia cavernae DSM 12333]|uniref:Coenzyme F420 biosynthesis-associated protein n=1 Tax=Beutenbergia cavernae (strain ATCC BAA-8 / DSM 12333 / CCUG 43141 / JCM 11478 / NBRC 16432 / NCIMB 13614 / HKI 0122) TaxID=471853 RepID=C5BYK2_BEUC1|nr:zinc-dependent metalloprotease [Beutenbergia cavernae]ACQ78960.1 conserved hypothetical protein [Beutenbergia cavernae DSM 12333]